MFILSWPLRLQCFNNWKPADLSLVFLWFTPSSIRFRETFHLVSLHLVLFSFWTLPGFSPARLWLFHLPPAHPLLYRGACSHSARRYLPVEKHYNYCRCWNVDPRPILAPDYHRPRVLRHVPPPPTPLPVLSAAGASCFCLLEKSPLFMPVRPPQSTPNHCT